MQSPSPKDKARVARACLQMANIYTLRKDYKAAESWFHKVLELADDDSILKAEAYQNLGSLFFLKENWEYAILNYRKAYLLYSKEPRRNCIRMADLLSSLGTSCSENGEFRKSYSCFQKADSLLKACVANDNDRLAALHINTGGILLKQNAPLRALHEYRLAAKLCREKSLSSSNILISSGEGMAECFSRLGKNDSAMSCLENCLGIIKSTGTNRKIGTAGIYLHMGKILAGENEWEQSIKTFDEAIGALFPDSLSLNFGGITSNYAPGFLDLFRILEYRGRSKLQVSKRPGSGIAALTGAYEDFCAALRICDYISSDLGHGSARMAFQESTKSILAGVVESGYGLHLITGKPGFDELLSLVDGGKNRMLLGDMEENRFLELSGISDSLKREIREVKDELVFSTRRYIRQESSYLSYPSGLMEMQDRMIDLHMRLDSLRKMTEPNYLNQQLQSQRTNTRDTLIRKRLKDDEAILEYFCTDSAIYLLLLRNNGIHVKRVTLTQAFRGSLAECLHLLKSAETRNFYSLSRDLGRYLFTPVSSGLTGIRRLIIVPDEELSLFPFETLIVDDQDVPSGPAADTTSPSSWHFLLRDFEISYHFSGAGWSRDTCNRGFISGSTRFAGFAPGFGSADPSFLSPIPYTLKEITGIAGLFRSQQGDPILFSDTAATESKFRQKAPGFTHIHIATHSRVNDVDPMNSALVFSGNIREGDRLDKDDGLLHLDEVSNLKLNASLVVLSACSTGEGKVTKTEGVLALTRGFYLAGASNVVYSLWSIPDHLTSDFMLSFYRDCFSGRGYSAALREVKLKMISRTETSLPYMWAGIVLLGK